MLWLNFFRDLKSTLSRMVSVTIITMLAVMVYVGLAGINYNVDLFCEEYFQDQNTADYWISGMGLSGDDCDTLEEIDGVTAVRPRVVLEARDKEDSAVIIQLYASPLPLTINVPTLTEGVLPADGEEMVLSDEFAAANGLNVGDWYEMEVTGTGQTLRLRVSGLGKSAELMRHISVTTPSSDLGQFGFAYLDSGALEALTLGYYNQICLTVTEGTDGDALLRSIDDALGERVVSVLALEDNTAAYSFKSVTNDLQPVLDLFPILFFLCSILMMVSNMSRLIEGARMNIGTFKALGYRDNTILLYYLLHAVLVVLVGFPLGALPSKILTRIVVSTMAVGCDLPDMPLLFNYTAWVQAFVLTALCCLGSAFLVARSSLKESPAQCMRPKPPKSTKPVLLERLPRIWRRLSFNQKYITRSTLRNKARMLTCVVGITFCMALVLASFGLHDSVHHYVEALTGNQNRYDIVATLNSGVTEEEYESLAALDGAAEVEYEMTTACWLFSDSALTTAALQVAEDTPTLRLCDPYAEDICALPAGGVILRQSIADGLGVGEGDTLTLRFPGSDELHKLPVAEVSRNVSGVYISRGCWQSLDQTFTPTTAYLTAVDQDTLTSELDDCDFVDGWQTHAVVVDAAAERLDSAATVAYVMILFGGALACVVIYNLGIMSFFEQVRALATLMVLGFFDREIKRLQLSENTIFAAAGVVLGLPCGVALTHAFIRALNALPLEVSTRPVSYLLSIALTMLFALLVNAFIGHKMKDIDMLGALKSVE